MKILLLSWALLFAGDMVLAAETNTQNKDSETVEHHKNVFTGKKSTTYTHKQKIKDAAGNTSDAKVKETTSVSKDGKVTRETKVDSDSKDNGGN